MSEAESGESLASASVSPDYGRGVEAPVCEDASAMVKPQSLSVDLLGLSGFLCSLSLDLEEQENSWSRLCRAGARALAILPCQVGFAWDEGKFTREHMPELLAVDSNAIFLSVVRESPLALLLRWSSSAGSFGISPRVSIVLLLRLLLLIRTVVMPGTRRM